MKQLTPWQNALMMAGGLLMVASLIARIFLMWPYLWLPYLTGVLCYGALQMLQRYDGRNLVIRRLRRIQLFSDLSLILSGFAMALPAFSLHYGHRNEWLLFLAIGAVLQLYTAFRLPSELEKEMPEKR